MFSPAIEVMDLTKTYPGAQPVQAVDGVSFAAQQGEIFSLLGPNGAGKTTTISILSGLLRPTSGEARVLGRSITREPIAVKSSLGVVPQDIALYEDLSARENLFFWGRMYGLGGKLLGKRVDDVLEVIGLRERQHERISKYSGGMKRRVNIAAALLHQPSVIYMDEPTVGIDPQSRRSILDSVVALKNQGMTVLYTTHYMEEAEELSDQIAIMDHGKIVASGTNAELVRMVGALDRIRLTLNAESSRVIDAWRGVPGVSKIDAEDGALNLLVEDSNQVLPRLFEAASTAKVRITSVDIQAPNLETVFLHLTGRALRD